MDMCGFVCLRLRLYTPSPLFNLAKLYSSETINITSMLDTIATFTGLGFDILANEDTKLERVGMFIIVAVEGEGEVEKAAVDTAAA